ncbi:MAG TPA: hypothetical protein VHH36_04775, partial [Candidatus Thermoplasmatota archaeon]|nr:hypothetical protein [Candidatus Thermoplasmatota archaeon]
MARLATDPPHGRLAARRTRAVSAFAWRGADVAAAAIVLLALALRLREPLSSPVIGAEDPYLRMANAWDVAQGRGLFTSHYPPGFSLLLAPFALMGPEVFYVVGRFLPPFLGAAQVLGVYALGRAYLRPVGALGGALVVALIPENVFRTNLLFPTALDLAVLPWLFLAALRAHEGSRRALVAAGAMLAALLVTHPWVVALVVPVLAVHAALLLARSPRRAAMALAAVGVAGALLLLVLGFLPGTWNPAPAFLRHAGPRFAELARDPSSLFPLPIHVNLPLMLTWPAIALALAGAAVALVRRTPLALLALAWSALLLPFVLVDWFEVWF